MISNGTDCAFILALCILDYYDEKIVWLIIFSNYVSKSVAFIDCFVLYFFPLSFFL
jgi:hypothetical protein